MRMWDTIKKRWRGLMQRTAGAAGVAREFKDIFELGGVPAFNQFYVFGIFVWKALYRGLYKPWHVILAPTVGDDKARRELYRLNAPKAVVVLIQSTRKNRHFLTDVYRRRNKLGDIRRYRSDRSQ